MNTFIQSLKKFHIEKLLSQTKSHQTQFIETFKME